MMGRSSQPDSIASMRISGVDCSALNYRLRSPVRNEACFLLEFGRKNRVSVTGKVRNGVVELPGDVPWPSGTLVRVEPLEQPPPPLSELMKDFDGMANDLPSDLAANVDHYLHGHPRK